MNDNIEKLFREARRADEASTPPFDSVCRAPRPPRHRVFRVAFATSAAGVALAAMAWVVMVDEVAMPTRDSNLTAPVEPLRALEDRDSLPDPVPAPPPPPGPAAKPKVASPQVAQREPAPSPKSVMTESKRKLLAALGYVAEPNKVREELSVVAEGDVVDLEETAQTTKFTDEYIQSLPVPGRFYQNVLTLQPGVQDADGDGNPNVHASRNRDFKAGVGGVSNVAARQAGSDSQHGLAVERLRILTKKQGDIEQEVFNTERYDTIKENDFLSVVENPLSTFSIDVDTASYANVRRFLEQGTRPPRDAVRIEELINYFDYDYPQPAGDVPFSASIEVAGCPWNPKHRLARIGLKGREIHRGEHPGSNLVFLIDVSGSMQPNNKLPLLKSALGLLVGQLDGRDQLAIVVYAGASGLVLPSTSGNARGEILGALNRLQAGGSTNGGSGLRLAYRVARENFIPGGVNRVILATDGDFNVGVTQRSELLKLIKKDADRGIFLTTLGFGMGDYQDATLEQLADKGNGNYAYIDRMKEAHKVLVEEIGGTLITIAKDVKIQVEFNPAEVGAYRLIGYENRMLAKEDFNDDTKDAGEIGAGHTVTALYELVPPQEATALPSVDPLKYQTPPAPSKVARGGELFTLKLRYKEPEGQASRLLSFPVTDDGLSLDVASPDFKFATAVAMFGMVLRDSPHRGEATLVDAQRLCLTGLGADAHGYRNEFHRLVGRAMAIMGSGVTISPGR